MQVTFKHNFGGYNEGETASFPEDRALALLKANVAVEHVEAETPVEVEAPKSKKKKPTEPVEETAKEDVPCPAEESPAANQF